jgi:hypothetical protein
VILHTPINNNKTTTKQQQSNTPLLCVMTTGALKTESKFHNHNKTMQYFFSEFTEDVEDAILHLEAKRLAPLVNQQPTQIRCVEE